MTIKFERKKKKKEKFFPISRLSFCRGIVCDCLSPFGAHRRNNEIQKLSVDPGAKIWRLFQFPHFTLETFQYLILLFTCLVSNETILP